MSDALIRKTAELESKLASLKKESNDWRELSTEKGPLEKHHSQIRRMTRQIDNATGLIKERLDKLTPDGAAVLVVARQIESQILELHRIWHYFRGKLVQRHVPGFQKYLAVADELAWYCYQQARSKSKVVAENPEYAKEPPLVFFNGGASPFIVTRQLSWYAEPVGRSVIRTEEFVQLLRRLPVPVIGVPWFQLAHLPDILVIGHEVGHCVEADFELTKRLISLINDAAPQHYHLGWRSWAGEVFADVYGALSLGPSFAGALMDFLLDDPALLQHEQPDAADWGEYPPSAIRIALVASVLDETGFTEQSNALMNEWTEAVGESVLHDHTHLADVTKVVASLLDGPYAQFGDRKLVEVVSFDADDHATAIADAEHFLDKVQPKSSDVRVLLCAARLAFVNNAKTYFSNKVAERTIKRVLDVRAEGVRDTVEFRDHKQKVNAFDAKRGSELLSFLDERLAYDNAIPPI